MPTGIFKRTKGHKEKISRALKGKKKSKKHCENMSKSGKGKKLSKEHKRNIGIASKGRIVIKETREKISKANKGKKRTKEFCLKQSKNATIQTIKRGYHWSKHYYQGSFFSKKNNKDVRYKSGFEYGFYKVLELLDCVVKYDVECLYIQYQLMGKTKHYVPDVLIHYKDGTKQLVEVKGLKEVKTKINQAKFKAAKKYCKKNNLEFKVWTGDGFLN